MLIKHDFIFWKISGALEQLKPKYERPNPVDLLFFPIFDYLYLLKAVHILLIL